MDQRLETDRKTTARQPMRGMWFYILLFGSIIATWVLAVFVTHM